MNPNPNMENLPETGQPGTDEASAADRRVDRARRLRRRSAAVTVTVLSVVAVLLVNLLFSYLGYAHIWQVDETRARYLKDKRGLYTASEPFLDLIRNSAVPAVDTVNAERAARGEDRLTVNVIFCADRDKIYASNLSRYVLYSVLDLREHFPDYVTVSFVDIAHNPSAVQKYKATSSTSLYETNVIFEFGTEFRVYALNRFFVTNENSTTPWAYNGEMDISSAILAVTRAESPIACFTTNHGENTDSCRSLRELVARAGYIVQDIDLERDEIPADCRLLITYDPQTDFRGYTNNGGSGVSEIDRLDKFLDNAFSFLLFVDDETPTMPVLEEYLEEWGIRICRVQDNESGKSDNYHIRDTVQRLDTDGYTVLGNYVTSGLGSSVTKDMRNVAYPAKVVFPHATSVTRSDSYRTTYVSSDEASDGKPYSYEGYYRNGVSRRLSNLFTTYPTASAEVFGAQYEIATEQNLFRLMTLTSEERTVQETNYMTKDDRSFVGVCASTEFASDALLDSAVYGNADVLLSLLRSMGRELVPVKTLEFKGFKKYEIDAEKSGLTSDRKVGITVAFTLIPAVLCAGAGIAVSVRRKYR